MAFRVARDYQGASRDFGLDRPRFNLWAGTGTGKTSVGVELYDHLRFFDEAQHLLVVSTKRVAKHVWTNELRKWENFEHLSISTAIGTPDQRIAALRAHSNITTINYDNLPWLIDVAGDEWYWDMVIADESSRLKNLRIDTRVSTKGKVFLRKSGGSERAMRIAKIAHKKVRRWANFTGTPASNGLIDLWGQAWYLDGGQRLGRTFTAFKNRWFRQIKVGDDAFQFRLEAWPFAEEQIKAALSDLTLTIEAKDYFDLPPTVVNRIPITLPPKAYAHYREMEREMFTEIKNREIEAVNAGSKSMKLRQLASGAAYVQPDDGSDAAQWVDVHDEKIEALRDIVSDLAGEPVVVAYFFKSDLARLKKAFPEGVYFDDSAKTLDDFCAGRIPVLFLHPASAAHGIDGMQEHCRNIVWFSMTWNLEDFQQTNERIGATRQVQSGFYRTVYVHLLVGENTIEEDMVDRVESKASVQDAVKAAMKKRG